MADSYPKQTVKELKKIRKVLEEIRDRLPKQTDLAEHYKYVAEGLEKYRASREDLSSDT